MCLQHIVVGTPGRLKALVKDGHLKLTDLKHFVLDECDRMLDELGKLPLAPFSGLVSLRPVSPWQTCAVTSRRSSSRPHTRSRL